MSDIVKYNYGALMRQQPQKVFKEIIKIKTINQAIEKRTEMPSLGKMKRDLGEEKASAYIELLIINLNEFFNIKDKMKPDQIKETSAMILEEYNYLSLLEIIFVLKEAKKGVYGEIYNSLDGSKIMKWFSSYVDKRAELFAKKSEEESNKYKFRDDHLRTSKPNKIRK